MVGGGGGGASTSGAGGTRDERASLDQSMDSHFSYIQEVSAPQELDGLLPKLHETLVRVRPRGGGGHCGFVGNI